MVAKDSLHNEWKHLLLFFSKRHTQTAVAVLGIQTIFLSTRHACHLLTFKQNIFVCACIPCIWGIVNGTCTFCPVTVIFLIILVGETSSGFYEFYRRSAGLKDVHVMIYFCDVNLYEVESIWVTKQTLSPLRSDTMFLSPAPSALCCRSSVMKSWTASSTGLKGNASWLELEVWRKWQCQMCGNIRDCANVKSHWW